MKRRGRATKRAAALVKGLQISWTDRHPLTEQSEPIPGDASHRNPLLRTMAREIYLRHKDWITCGHQFHWLVRITVVFRYPNGHDQLEERELEARAKFTDLNDCAMEQIADALRYGAEEKYLITRFDVECLGT